VPVPSRNDFLSQLVHTLGGDPDVDVNDIRLEIRPHASDR
jgi:hypothetical protein